MAILLLEDVSVLRRIDMRKIKDREIVHNPDVNILLTYYHDLKVLKQDISKRKVITTENYLDNNKVDEEVLMELINSGLSIIIYETVTDLVIYV